VLGPQTGPTATTAAPPSAAGLPVLRSRVGTVGLLLPGPLLLRFLFVRLGSPRGKCGHGLGPLELLIARAAALAAAAPRPAAVRVGVCFG
jgi:hypothetical protein